MSENKINQKPVVSVFRLRLGVFFVFLWWLPVWLLGPVLAYFTGMSAGTGTMVIAIVQTIFGLIGLFLVGPQTAKVFRHTKVKQAFKDIWHIVWTGESDAIIIERKNAKK